MCNEIKPHNQSGYEPLNSDQSGFGNLTQNLERALRPLNRVQLIPLVIGLTPGPGQCLFFPIVFFPIRFPF